jgi:hypothetical protein
MNEENITTKDDLGQTTVRPAYIPPADVPIRKNPKPPDAPVETDPEPSPHGVPLRDSERNDINAVLEAIAKDGSLALDSMKVHSAIVRLLDAYDVVSAEAEAARGENAELMNKMFRDDTDPNAPMAPQPAAELSEQVDGWRAHGVIEDYDDDHDEATLHMLLREYQSLWCFARGTMPEPVVRLLTERTIPIA